MRDLTRLDTAGDRPSPLGSAAAQRSHSPFAEERHQARVTFVSLEHQLAAWNDTSIASSSDLLVVLALTTFADRSTGSAWMSLAALATRSRQNIKTVRAAIERLQRAGTVAVKARDGRPSLITLTIPTARSDSGTGAGSGVPSSGTPADRIWSGLRSVSGTRTKEDTSERDGSTVSSVAVAAAPGAATSSTCPRHPRGTDQPCVGCRNARLALAGTPRPAQALVDGCASIARTGLHWMIDGDRFCNSCGLDPRTGDRRDNRYGTITPAALGA